MRVKGEGKLIYSLYHFIDNTGKIDGKSKKQAASVKVAENSFQYFSRLGV